MPTPRSPGLLRSSFLCLFLIFLFSSQLTLAQSTQDVLYLKNGWILRGEITNWEVGQSVSIRTPDNQVFVFDEDEVLRSEKESFASQRKEILIQGRGYYSVSSLGLLLGSQDYGSAAALSINSYHGYRFSPFFGLGGGLSLDLFQDGFLMPIMADLRGDILQKPVTPIWYAQGGISVPLYSLDNYDHPWQPPSQNNHQTKIGEAWEVGTGFKVRTTRNLSWVVSLGYRVQVVTHLFDYGDGGRTERELTFQRLAFRIGLEF